MRGGVASGEGGNGGAVSSPGAAGVRNVPAGGEATGGVQNLSAGGEATGGAEAEWGGAPASAGAGGESGEGGEAGVCREWPQDCAVRCQEPLGACLMDESGQVPSDARRLSLEITEASSAHPPRWNYHCVGYLWYDQPATTLVGTDSDGNRWTLGFSSPLLPVTRFPLGSTLEVESLHLFRTQFEPTRALTLRQGEQIIAHFEAGPHETAAPAELGVTVEEAELACPWSLPDDSGCSFANFHTRARWENASVDDPCSAELGPFVVSSSFHGGRYLRECDGRMGACDAADDFLVSIVRKE